MIRVRFTPSIHDKKTLESLQEACTYVLMAAVRMRGRAPEDMDRIRIFDQEDIDVLPVLKSTTLLITSESRAEFRARVAQGAGPEATAMTQRMMELFNADSGPVVNAVTSAEKRDQPSTDGFRMPPRPVKKTRQEVSTLQATTNVQMRPPQSAQRPGTGPRPSSDHSSLQSTFKSTDRGRRLAKEVEDSEDEQRPPKRLSRPKDKASGTGDDGKRDQRKGNEGRKTRSPSLSASRDIVVIPSSTGESTSQDSDKLPALSSRDEGEDDPFGSPSRLSCMGSDG
ncbi:hypothetical protein CkaCkLH20_09448 [Colletotrichum karsti]|uniref:Uncharacterized protein n=1 Tax=Colletotrichum karsti TaxID=1095194 RepID=A0A9P6LGW7_9PEZI|nr:uncharacterized protein CkaCkLH20_09448 [Colletotrichum karsti]KAF9872938.1 hypothetical protein CkaCkLH20_09448 [Colletotrichum karsti]